MCGWSSRALAPPSSSFSSVRVHDAAYVAGLVDIDRSDPSWSVESKAENWTATAVDELNRVNSVTVVLRRKSSAPTPPSREVATFWLVCNEADTSQGAGLLPQGAPALQTADLDDAAFESASCSCATLVVAGTLGIKCKVAFTNLKGEGVAVPVLVRVSFSELKSPARSVLGALV